MRPTEKSNLLDHFFTEKNVLRVAGTQGLMWWDQGDIETSAKLPMPMSTAVHADASFANRGD